MHKKLKFIGTKLLFSLLATPLLLAACLVQSDSPVIKEREQPGALNLLASKTTDISGTFFYPEGENSLSLKIVRKENTDNAYSMEAAENGKKNTMAVLVQDIGGKGNLLLQLSDSKEKGFMLLPANLSADGLRLYFPVNPEKKDKRPAWNNESWLTAVARQKLELSKNNEKLIKGSMTDDEYSQAVFAVFTDMFEANALGNGMLFIPETKFKAYLESMRKQEAFAVLCKTAGPAELDKALKDGIDINADLGDGPPLAIAAANNPNPESVKALVKAGADINFVSSRTGKSILEFAVNSNPNPQIIAALIEAGAVVKAENSIIYHCLDNPNALELIDLLLKAGAKVDVDVPRRGTAFFVAVEESKLDMAKKLLEAGADINSKNSYGQTAFFNALESNNTAALAFLLENKADINSGNDQGVTPLMLAVQRNDKKLVTDLLNAGADINAKNKSGKSVFATLLERGDASEEEILNFLAKGADINTSYGWNKQTLIMREVREGKNAAFLAKLLEFSPDLSLTNSDGKTIFELIRSNYNASNEPGLLQWVIAYLKDPALLDLLLKAGAEVNQRDKKGNTPLMIAAAVCPEPIVAKLLSAGATIDSRGEHDNSALHNAAKNSSPEVLATLLKAGADAKSKNKKGDTPLIYAAGFNKNIEVLKTLLKATDYSKQELTAAFLNAAAYNPNAVIMDTLLAEGADLQATIIAAPMAAWNNQSSMAELLDYNPQAAGKTKASDEKRNALMLAALNNSSGEVIIYLHKAGLDINGVTAMGYTPLLLACAKNCNPDVITALLQCGAGTEQLLKQKEQNSIMHLAALSAGNPQAIKELFFAGAKINATDKNNITPLMLAAEKNLEPAITEILIALGADGRLKGGNYNPKTAFEMADYRLHDKDVYWKLKDAQFNEPKKLNPELESQRNKYLALLKSSPTLSFTPADFAPSTVSSTASASSKQAAANATASLQAPPRTLSNDPAPDTAGATSDTTGQSQMVETIIPTQNAAANSTSQSQNIAKNGTNSTILQEGSTDLIQPAAANATIAASADSPAKAGTNTTTADVPETEVYPPLQPVAKGKAACLAHYSKITGKDVSLNIQVLAPGKNIQAVRIDNIGGQSSSWRSDGADKANALAVTVGDKNLSTGKELFSLPLGEKEEVLSVKLEDNGAFAGKKTEFRITVFFTDKTRAMTKLAKLVAQ